MHFLAKLEHCNIFNVSLGVLSNSTQNLMAALLTRLLNSWFEFLLSDIAVKNVYIFQLETQAKVKISGNDVINDVGQQTISRSRTLKKTHSNAIVTNLRNIEKCLTFLCVSSMPMRVAMKLIIQRII